MYKFILFLCSLSVAVGCDNYPRDPENTLDKIRNHVLKVGVSYARSLKPGLKGPEGFEAELIRAFAASQNARIEWIEGSQSEVIELLKEHVVHVAIGGYEPKSPFSKEVSFSKKIKTDTLRIFSAALEPKPDIKDKVVYISDPTFAAYLRKEKAIPRVADTVSKDVAYVLATHVDSAHARFTPTSLILHESDIAIAVSKGENRFMMELEKFIENYAGQKR